MVLSVGLGSQIARLIGNTLCVLSETFARTPNPEGKAIGGRYRVTYLACFEIESKNLFLTHMASFDLEKLSGWLGSHVAGFQGPIVDVIQVRKKAIFYLLF